MTLTMKTRIGSRSRQPRDREPALIAPPPSMMPSRPARILTVALLLVAAVYFIFPLVWMLFAVTKSDTELATTSGFWFGPDIRIGDNLQYLSASTNSMFFRWVGNSLFYSVTAGVVGTLFGVMAGYSIAKFRFPGRKAVMGVVMGSLLLPTGILTVPLADLFHKIGLVNTIWAILIPSFVSTMGVFLGMIYVQSSVPDELLEAARIDGASEVRIFFTMVLRIVSPALVTIFLFMFVGTWNNFMLPLMMISSDDLKPISLGLYGMMSALNANRPVVILGALIGIIPLIILFFSLQRYWRAGLTAGAVKT